MINQDLLKHWQAIDIDEMNRQHEAVTDTAIRCLFFSSLRQVLVDMPTIERVYLDPKPLLPWMFVRLIVCSDRYLLTVSPSFSSDTVEDSNLMDPALVVLCQQFYEALRPANQVMGVYSKIQKALAPCFAPTPTPEILEVPRELAILACEHCLTVPGFTLSKPNLEAQLLTNRTGESLSSKSWQPRL